MLILCLFSACNQSEKTPVKTAYKWPVAKPPVAVDEVSRRQYTIKIKNLETT